MVEFSFKIASTDYNIQKKNLPQITFVNLAKIEKKTSRMYIVDCTQIC